MAEETKTNSEIDNENDTPDDVGNDNQSTESQTNNEGENKTFTQAHINAMMANEKKQGRNSVYNKLGIDPKDKNMLELIKNFVESHKATKSNDSSDDSSEMLAKAEKRAAAAEAKAEAMMQGAKAEYVEDLILIASSRVDEQNDLKAVIASLKSKYPSWFNGSNDESNNQGAKGTGSSIGNDSHKSGESSLAKKLAAKRVAANNKKSFWA